MQHKLDKKTQIIIFILLLALIVGAMVYYNRYVKTPTNILLQNNNNQPTLKESSIPAEFNYEQIDSNELQLSDSVYKDLSFTNGILDGYKFVGNVEYPFSFILPVAKVEIRKMKPSNALLIQYENPIYKNDEASNDSEFIANSGLISIDIDVESTRTEPFNKQSIIDELKFRVRDEDFIYKLITNGETKDGGLYVIFEKGLKSGLANPKFYSAEIVFPEHIIKLSIMGGKSCDCNNIILRLAESVLKIKE